MTSLSASTLRTPADATAAAAASRQPMENSRGLAAMLLAAAVAALAVVADQLIDTWADGHLMLAWIVLWSVVFVGSLLLTGTARRASQGMIAGLNGWARARAQARADARLLNMAAHDPRVRAELRAVQAATGADGTLSRQA
jgi:hypothetical protein